MGSRVRRPLLLVSCPSAFRLSAALLVGPRWQRPAGAPTRAGAGTGLPFSALPVLSPHCRPR